MHRLRVAGRRLGPSSRFLSTSARAPVMSDRDKNLRLALLMTSVAVGTLAASYGAVPLYKVFCRATGFGGTTQEDENMDRAKSLVPVTDYPPLKITFAAQTSDTLPWSFVPQQREIKVVPGETALAFYTATNKSKQHVTGVATYNVVPSKAGAYFHKIQCFCFDEQRLRPNESVDMPVFFYIDPSIAEDPHMRDVTNICLSYTFFPSKA